jgi:pyridoxamine 5'-phosphate oxidase
MLFRIIQEWLENEEKQGSTNPNRGVLATADQSAIPHSRVVALREISEKGILFFTQQATQKVYEINENPYASMTIWLAQQQRQIILNGNVISLTQEENNAYWETMQKDRQLRFTAYAPTSAQPIDALTKLNQHYEELCLKYKDRKIPMSPFYCGFRLTPNEIYFYTLGYDSFSSFIKYKNNVNGWKQELLSP